MTEGAVYRKSIADISIQDPQTRQGKLVKNWSHCAGPEELDERPSKRQRTTRATASEEQAAVGRETGRERAARRAEAV